MARPHSDARPKLVDAARMICTPRTFSRRGSRASGSSYNCRLVIAATSIPREAR